VKSLLSRREKPLMVAVTTIQGDGSGPNPHAARVARGMTLPHDHYLVRAHPEAFEPAPTGVVRGPSPRSKRGGRYRQDDVHRLRWQVDLRWHAVCSMG
jgi:hypothetical protein